ncbi:hypothetical protein BH23GEM4_BH23GEM4_06230 [soil metagenome]
MPAERPPRIPDYDLAAPTESDQLAALTRTLGPERAAAAWRAARESAGFADGGTPTREELMRICNELAKQDGLVRVLAHSMIIRLRTYSILERHAQAAASAGGASR